MQTILKWSEPIKLKWWRWFLGLSGYYKRFTKNYATLVEPLTNLLKKYVFGWL